MVTYAVFGAVVFFGEVIAISDEDSSAKHIHLPTYGQITVLIKLLMDSSCLQEKERRKRGE